MDTNSNGDMQTPSGAQSSNMTTIIVVVVVLALVVVGFFVMGGKGAEAPATDTQATDEPVVSSTDVTTQAAPAGDETVAPTTHEITMTGSNFAFSQTEIRVKQGDTVRLTFKNEVGTHDWKIDEFDAATKILSAGAEETIEFVASTKGTFEYYCSVGQHRQMGMKGNLIVE